MKTDNISEEMPEVRSEPTHKRQKPLHDWVHKNSVNSIEFYLENERRDSTLNGIDDQGRSPLHIAARLSRYEGAKLLFLAGADPSAADLKGVTPLHEAVERGCTDIVQLFSSSDRCNLNAQNSEGHTALMRAIYFDYVDIVKVLHEAGADINLVDTSGRTALLIGLWEGSTKSVEFLIKKGCDLNIVDSVGHGAFYAAVNSDLLPDLRPAQLIVQHGYDVRKDSWWLNRMNTNSRLVMCEDFYQRIMKTINPHYSLSNSGKRDRNSSTSESQSVRMKRVMRLSRSSSQESSN